MNPSLYRCPVCHASLAQDAQTLVCAQGHRHPVVDGLPDFVPQESLNEEQRQSIDYYDQSAAIYDDVADLSFRIQKQDEAVTRREFVKLLALQPDDRVLEIATGTGRDAVNIAEQLGADGLLCAMDLSRAMLLRCREKLADAKPAVELCVGSASSLPFADGTFDALFSFGGLNVFPDVAGALREMVRVCKPGARIVVGDESLGPWLHESEYGRILLHNSPLFRHQPPLHLLPVQARKVRLQWVVGAAYYLIDFEVGEGEPPADFDIEIPGARGGTLRTRYHGRLEGVSPETLALARKAREKSGQSMHHWLDDVVRAAALKALEDDGSSS
ncbi:methyltransferase domain-containing protein [Piscinibacter terrae]|uniref:Methyltransferase domain-containing protein n=1 Tax=Piscinibacter terrae TaxID=2496871 RepID=A0A3N7K027_9BURK|nr:methyltransferase domain-containing protein [Albitalea terrae]RQP24375.1 methyltransferase domain-containing protein [Albitalea terrae]